MSEVFTFGRKTPKQDVLLGLSASVVMHILVGVMALLTVMWSPRKELKVPFYKVRLVEPGDIGLPPTVNTKLKKFSLKRMSQRNEAPVVPVMPVKRLRYKETSSHVELKKKELAVAPKQLARVPAPIEKSLDKLIPQKNKKALHSPKPPVDYQDPELRTANTDQKTQAASPVPWSTQSDSAVQQDDEEIGLAQKLYYTEVWNAIRNQWALPPLLQSSKLEAVVILVVRRDGRILDIRFEKKSGNEVFDDSVIRAVKKANPLPPFPEIYSPQQVEIGVRFRPQQLRS